jgi:hypothetical protein
MPRLKQWIVARTSCPVFKGELARQLSEMGADLGDGHFETSQIVHVNHKNREKVIELLKQHGFTVEDVEKEDD